MKFILKIGKAQEIGHHSPESGNNVAQVDKGIDQNRRQFFKNLGKVSLAALSLSSGSLSLVKFFEQDALAGGCSKEGGWDCAPQDLEGILPVALEELYHKHLDVIIDIEGVSTANGKIVGIQKKVLKQGAAAFKEADYVNTCMLQYVREPALREDGLKYTSTSCDYDGVTGSRFMVLKHESDMVRFVYRMHKFHQINGDIAMTDFIYQEHRSVVLGLVKKLKTDIKEELQAKGILQKDGSIDQVALLADLQQQGLVQNGKASQSKVISGLRRLGMMEEESDVVLAKGY